MPDVSYGQDIADMNEMPMMQELHRKPGLRNFNGSKVCANRETASVIRLRFRDSKWKPTMSDLVEVYRGINGPQAHVVRNFLQNAGIPAVVDGDQLQNVLGELVVGWPTSPRVLVSAENAAWAKSLIDAVESSDDEPLPEAEEDFTETDDQAE